MADTELKGTIKFTADTSDAEKKVDALEDRKSSAVDNKSSKSAQDISSGLAEALEENKDKAKGFSHFLGKELEASLSKSLSNSFSKFGRLGEVIGGAFKKFRASVPESISPKPDGTYDLAQKNVYPHLGGKLDSDNTYALSGDGVSSASAAAPESAAAGAGGSGLMVAAGVGVALATVVGFGLALKGAVSSVLSFDRSLSESSSAMASVVAGFDVQILMLKKQIGDQLAPAMRDLFKQVIGLARDAMPVIVSAMKIFASVLGGLIKFIRAFIPGENRGIRRLNEAVDLNKALHGGPIPANIKELINRALNKVDKAADKVIDMADQSMSGSALLSFRDFLMDQKSEQSKAEARLQDAVRDKYKDFEKNGPQLFTFHPRSGPGKPMT